MKQNNYIIFYRCGSSGSEIQIEHSLTTLPHIQNLRWFQLLFWSYTRAQRRKKKKNILKANALMSGNTWYTCGVRGYVLKQWALNILQLLEILTHFFLVLQHTAHLRLYQGSSHLMQWQQYPSLRIKTESKNFF